MSKKFRTENEAVNASREYWAGIQCGQIEYHHGGNPLCDFMRYDCDACPMDRLLKQCYPGDTSITIWDDHLWAFHQADGGPERCSPSAVMACATCQTLIQKIIDDYLKVEYLTRDENRPRPLPQKGQMVLFR